MKSYSLFFMVFALILAACGSQPGPEPTNVGATEPALEPVEDVFPKVTITPTAVREIESAPETAPDDSSYPAPPTITPFPEGYPAIVTPAPTHDPYPAGEGTIWIIRPVGIQCESPNDYADIQAAVADLKAIGVETLAQEMIDIPVTAVCGAPTSAHFRVQINAPDLAKAELLGWMKDEFSESD